jgi:hypothetical protein
MGGVENVVQESYFILARKVAIFGYTKKSLPSCLAMRINRTEQEPCGPLWTSNTSIFSG